jgi:hypothetical protein
MSSCGHEVSLLEYLDLIEGDFVSKSRYIWDVRALQLLREKAAVQYALKTVPRMVSGVCIEFPETEISLGLRVTVRSRLIEGQNLFPMLYHQETRGLALDMAMIALEALRRADVTSNPFAFFGQAYGFVRRRKVALGELFGPSLLSSEQRIRLNRLLVHYAKTSESGKKALVHGDLHADNLVVSLPRKSLGFVDLELMHIGKPVTNFAQLWIGFHFADPLLGQRFYQRYARQFPDTLDEQFDASLRAEIALRCYSMIRDGKRSGNIEMEEKSRILLRSVLDDRSFEEVCLSGGIC